MFRFTDLFKKMFTFRFTILFKKIFMFANLCLSRCIGQHCRLPLANEKHVLVGLKQKYLLSFLRNFKKFHGTYRHPQFPFSVNTTKFLLGKK
jgi:hypothetical protein